MAKKEKEIIIGKKFNNENEPLEELKNILNQINNWLQFAEAKHGALLAINLVLIFECVDFFYSINKEEISGNKCFLFIIIILYCISTILSFISFVPKINTILGKISVFKKLILIVKKIKLNFFYKDKERNNKKILIFYGDICKYNDCKEYLKDFFYRYFNIRKTNFEKIYIDYTSEILINSRIALSKYRLFKYSILLEIVATVLLCIFFKVTFVV